MLPADFSLRVSIHDGCEKSKMPEWAASLMWLGSWCRTNQIPGKRLVIFAILPTRDLGSAFAGMGCLVAGASAFEDSLSWSVFKKLPIGGGVFWSHKNTMARYAGNILGFKESEGAEFIVVKVTKASRKAELGSIREISQSYFDDYRFTEEKPLSQPKSELSLAAEQSIRSLVPNLNPKWIWADGAEGLIITSVASFEEVVAGISISIDEGASINLSDFLCLGRNKENVHSKMRFEHPKGILEGNFPLVILDGPTAFMAHEHIARESNLMVILDRSEYREDINNLAISLRSVSLRVDDNIKIGVPDKFAPGIELAAYLIDS